MKILVLVLDCLLEKFNLSEFVRCEVVLSRLDMVALAEVLGRVAELAHLLEGLIYFFEILLLAGAGLLILRSFL